MGGIEIIDHSEQDAHEREHFVELNKFPIGNFTDWKNVEDEIWEVAKRFGTVGSGSGEIFDFYSTLDWHHQYEHGFAINTQRPLQPECLRELQKTISRHHPSTCISLQGDFDTSVEGFECFITRYRITISCFDKDKHYSERSLKRLGIVIV